MDCDFLKFSCLHVGNSFLDSVILKKMNWTFHAFEVVCELCEENEILI